MPRLAGGLTNIAFEEDRLSHLPGVLGATFYYKLQMTKCCKMHIVLYLPNLSSEPTKEKLAILLEIGTTKQLFQLV